MKKKMIKHFQGRRIGILIWYDLNYGYQSVHLKWLGAVLVQAYFALIAVQSCAGQGMSAGVPEYLGFLFRGMPEYFVSETGRLELPVPWLMMHGYLLFLTVSYPAEDLARGGGQAMVRAGRRRDWLLGKAAWVGCTVVGYYLTLAAILAVCALATGGAAEERGGFGGMSAESRDSKGAAIESSGQADGFQTGQCGMASEELGDWEICLRCWVQPILVSLALCLAELALSLILEPALALFLMLGYLTASVFWASPLLLGNFSMLLRQDVLSGISGVCFQNCAFLCTLWSAGAMLLGAGWIGRKDIL